MHERRRARVAVLLACVLLATRRGARRAPVPAAATARRAPTPPAAASGSPRSGRPPSCRHSSIAPSTTCSPATPALRDAKVRVALLDLAHGEPPRLAHHHGDAPIYPASVVKFVYLMAAYRWQEEGRLRIDGDFDRELSAMIRESSNQATQKVFARLTETEPGPELPPEAYRDFRERRLAVKRWLASLGIDDLHCVNPTYDGNGDLFGRDAQFLRDASVAGGLGRGDGAARTARR